MGITRTSDPDRPTPNGGGSVARETQPFRYAGHTAAFCKGTGTTMTAVSPLGPSALADEAFEALYEQYSRRVFGYCLKWLRSREEAEDAVQTTFLYAMRGLRRGVVPKFDEAWLLAIARNVCRTRTEVTRRRAVEVTRSPQLLEESFAAPARTDELADLSEALGGLTEQQRRAILLREWQGLSYREIADELDLSQAAVETLLFRARRALAARLRGAGSFLPWLKSFAGGGAGSLAVGATVVAVTAAGTIGGGRPDRPARHLAPATQPAVHHVGTTVSRPLSRAQATPPPRRHASAQANVPLRSRAVLPPPVPAAATTTAAAGSAVAPTESTVATPNPAPGKTQTVTDATKPVADPAANTVETVVASATDATSTVETVASGAIATTTDAVASPAETVSATVPALPTVTVGDVVPSVPPLITP
jgi:RNA polymerase sigma-70 factor, ECF subfamily